MANRAWRMGGEVDPPFATAIRNHQLSTLIFSAACGAK